MQEPQVQLLAGELRSHMLCGMAKLKKKKGEPPLITVYIFFMHLGLLGVLQTGNQPDADSQSHHLPGSLSRAHR